MKYNRFILVILATICLHIHGLFEPAIIKVPIAELNTSLPILTDLPASPETAKCTRAHQALLNEQVNCIDENDDYYQVAFKNIVYGFDQETQKPLSTFWTPKSNIIFLKDLTESLTSSIPTQYGESTITLIYPWCNYSVGTRFKHAPQYDTTDAYAVEVIYYNLGMVSLGYIPRSSAHIELAQNDNRKELFVQLVGNLIDNLEFNCPNHIIPYVWGGSSFLHAHESDDFCLRDGGWHRNKSCNLYTGYDCSELVMRFAQMAGISFPWKTSAAIERSLKALSETDTLENGDIIWVPGHVMIISDIERNELIEARGYSSGYGCVHRITLNKCIDGIETYEQLVERYFSKQAIKFLNKQGEAVGKEHICKILKLNA